MSKPVKISIAVFVSVVFLLVSLSLLVKVVVTPDKIRENLLPFVEETLQRQVDINGIDIGIFSGVLLTDLRVMKKDSLDDFISVKVLALKYKILPLFKGNLVIDQILLEDPRIEITRTGSGEYNFSDLFSPEAASQSESKGVPSQQPSSGSRIFTLLINDISIKRGELLFVDRSQNATSPYRYQFQDLNFQASKMTLEESFPVNLTVDLDGSSIELAGQFNMADRSGDFDVRLNGLGLVKFAPYYQQQLPGRLSSGNLTLNLEVIFQQETIDSKGTVQLDDLDLTLDDFRAASLKAADLQFDYAVNFDLQQHKLLLSTLLVRLNNSAFEIEGVVDLGPTEPVLALKVLFDKLDLYALLEDLPAGLTKEMSAYRPAGTLDGYIELQGPVQSGGNLVKSATLDLTGVKVNIADYRADLTGRIDYAEQQLQTEQLQLNVAEQQLIVDLQADNLLNPPIRGVFQLSAEQLDLNRLLPAQAGEDEAPESGPLQSDQQTQVAAEIGPFDLPLELTGQLRARRLIYKQLTMENVQAELRLADNLLSIEPLRGSVAGGDLRVNSTIDLGVEGLQYQGQMSLAQSRLTTLVAGLLPQTEQQVSGILHWRNNFSGQGTLPDKFLRSLQLDGNLQLRGGQIAGSPLLEQLALFLGADDLKVLSFDKLESQYDLRQGLAQISGGLDSSKVSLKPLGTVDVDGTLDMQLDARIAPELTQNLGLKYGLKQTLSDENGWAVLPLAVTGTVSRPRIGLDAEALQRQANAKLKQQAAEQILKKVPPADGTEQDPVKKMLEGTLKKLFGN